VHIAVKGLMEDFPTGIIQVISSIISEDASAESEPEALGKKASTIGVLTRGIF